MSLNRSEKVQKAVDLVSAGEVASYAEAGRRTGADHSAVNRAWRKDNPGKTPPFKRPDVEVGPSDEAAGPSPAERALAQRNRELENRCAARTVEVREAKSAEVEAVLRAENLAREIELISAVESQPRPEWLTPGNAAKDHHGTIMALFSDFHYGEVVEPSEMAWYNAYNKEIADARIRRFFERTILMSRRFLAGVKYDGIVMPSLGDGISGEIHEEFCETNELTNYEAAELLIPLLEAGIGEFADEFGKVHVPCVPGNHPRDRRKPRYKGRVKHNADTFIMKQVARAFANDDRVTFDIPDGIMADFQVYDTRFRMEHGDEAKGGSGIQGAMLPIALMTHRRRKQAQAEGRPFDVLLMGHWHQYMSMVGKGFVVNGAGKGYDEYARGKAFEPEAPQQALLVVTPEHGIGVQAPLFVSKRSDEGW